MSRSCALTARTSDARSAGDELTRYHVEAGIARQCSRALTFVDTDWRRIADGYDALDRAVAEARPRPSSRAQPP